MMSLRNRNSANNNAPNKRNSGDNLGSGHIKKLRQLPGLAALTTTNAVFATTNAVAAPFAALAKQCKGIGKKPAVVEEDSSQGSSEVDVSMSMSIAQSLRELDALPELEEPPREPSELELLISRTVTEWLQQQKTGADSSESRRRTFSVTTGKLFHRTFHEQMLVAHKFIKRSEKGVHELIEKAEHLTLLITCANVLVEDLCFTTESLLETAARETDEFGILSQLLVLAQESMEVFLELPTILAVKEVDDKTTPEEASQIVRFIQHYFELIDGYGGGVIGNSPTWIQHADNLVSIYLQRGVVELTKDILSKSAKRRGEEDFVTQDGKLFTGHSQQISYIFNMQLGVAENCLPPQYMGKVVAACNQVVRASVGHDMMQVATLWKEMPEDLLCAIINDAYKLLEECEDRNAEYLDSEDVQAGEDLCQQLTDLTSFATQQLGERMMLDLRDPDPILTTIGDGATWENLENESESAVQRTNETLTDYFVDLERWLDPFFFPRVLKYCFDKSLEGHTSAFFANSMAGRLGSAATAAAAMRRDYDLFVICWSEGIPSRYHGIAGFYSGPDINERLHLLLSFHYIMMPYLQSEDVEEEVEAVLMQLGIEVGVPAVLHLVGLRGKQTKDASLRWHEALSRVKALVTSEGYQRKATHSYALPDLRNSHFLPNVQPPGARRVQKLRRDQPEAESFDISSSTDLVKGRRVQRMRQGVHKKIQNAKGVGKRLQGVRRKFLSEN